MSTLTVEGNLKNYGAGDGPSRAVVSWSTLRVNQSGYSVVEMIVVAALISVLSALAIPQIVASRRLTRSAAMTREMLSQMRLARQHAISERQAVTFQYNNLSKQISIIDHNNNTGPVLLTDPTFPNNAGSTVIHSSPLAIGGLMASEITYGIPTGLPTGALRDGTSLTPLTNNVLNITFQPDGSVINTAGDPIDRALFVYNNNSTRGTAFAISVLGASGRVKIWRYDNRANVYTD